MRHHLPALGNTVDAELDYTLLFDEENSKEKIPQSLQLEKYVIQYGNQKEKNLRVRFPVCGVYKVKVTGSGHFRSLLASFRLVCDKVMKDVQPYPHQPQDRVRLQQAGPGRWADQTIPKSKAS